MTRPRLPTPCSRVSEAPPRPHEPSRRSRDTPLCRHRGFVGVRLLLLARRTGEIPELTIGSGLFLTAGVSYPLFLAFQLGSGIGLGFSKLTLEGGMLALGLADPVVANRFLLWAISGASAFLGSLVTVLVLASGAVLLQHAGARLAMAAAGLTCSVAMLLAFQAPAACTAFILRRAKLARG